MAGDGSWASTAYKGSEKSAEKESNAENLPGSLGVSCLKITQKKLSMPLQHDGERWATRCVLNLAQLFSAKNCRALVKNKTKEQLDLGGRGTPNSR